jgi:hypothetical protein
MEFKSPENTIRKRHYAKAGPLAISGYGGTVLRTRLANVT